MLLQNQLKILFFTAFLMIVVGGISSTLVHSTQNKIATKTIPTLIPTSTPSNTPTPTPSKIYPTWTPKPTTSTTGTISIHIADGSIPNCWGSEGKDCFDPNLDNPIKDDSMEFVIKKEPDGQEIKTKDPVSDWSVKDLKPGRYRAFVSYKFLKYKQKKAECQGCQNSIWFGVEDTCGYVFDLNAGDNVKISCKFENSSAYIGKPLPTNGPAFRSPDTTAPHTNVFYPQNGGEITNKTDGKVCAYMSAPWDDSGPGNVETFYKFDSEEYRKGIGYLCTDSLANGPHYLSFYSKDQSGNTESVQTFYFTVNIPGN